MSLDNDQVMAILRERLNEAKQDMEKYPDGHAGHILAFGQALAYRSALYFLGDKYALEERIADLEKLKGGEG